MFEAHVAKLFNQIDEADIDARKTFQ